MSPDLLVFAKGVNSGYVPLGGVLVGDSIYETFTKRPYPAGMTYSGHPLACAAAVGAIGAMHDEGTVAAAARLGTDVLGPGLDRLAEKHPSVGRCAWRWWSLDRRTRARPADQGATRAGRGHGRSERADDCDSRACLDRSLVPLILGNRLHVAPPLNVADADATAGLTILDEALDAADAYLA